MAEDLRTISTFPHFHNFTASTALTEIKLPEACNRILLGSLTYPLFVVQNGGTDGGTVPANRGFVPKLNYIELPIGTGLEAIQSIYVAIQSGSGEISIVLLEW
jgi:hypothetical protein